MNKFLGLILLVLLVGCGQESSNKNEYPKEVVVILNAGVGITTTSGDFGQVSPTSSKVITFSIKNSGDAPLIGPPSIDNANFSIIYQNGCASVLPTKSCTIKVSFDAKGKTPGTYESNLNLDAFFLELSATIPAPVVPAPEVAQAQYQLSTSGSAITEIDFGSLTSTQNVTKTFYLKNISQSPINQAVSFPSNFLVSYDMCSNRAIAKGATCMVKLTLSASGKSGTQDASVSYAGINLLLKGNVQSTQLPPVITPAPDVDFLVSNQVVSAFDFGELSPTGSKLVTISLKNTGNVTLNESVILIGDYSLTYDTCSLKPIAINGTCLLKVNLSGAGKSGIVPGNVAFAGQNLSLTGFVATPATPSPTLFPEIVFMNGAAEVSTVDMGFFPYGTSQQLVINIKNKGTLADVAKTASLNNSSFSIGYNQCVNKALAVNESCQVRIIFAANGKPEGTYSSILSFGEQSLNLTAFAGNALITYEPVYSSFGTCSANLACSGSGTQTRSITSCQKLANGEPIEGGTLTDCASFAVPANLEQACSSPAGQIVVEIDNGDKTVSCLEGATEETFVSLACDNNYFVNGQVCSPDVITYEPVYSSTYMNCSTPNICDGQGLEYSSIQSCQKLRNGVVEVGGQLSDCSAFSQLVSRSCFSPSGDKNILVDNGSRIVNCAQGSTVQNPVSISCNTYYKPSGDSLSCTNKLCSELSPLESSSLGYNLTNASLLGTYPSCSLNCTSLFQQPNGAQSACEDKPILNASFSFSNNYTNQSSTSVVVSAQNAQEVAFFNDASCSSVLLNYSNLSTFNNLISVGTTNGVKNVYAKFKNGSQFSTCIADSIIIDTTVPSSFTVTLAQNTTGLNTAVPSVSFSPSLSSLDASGIYLVEYGIGTTSVTTDFVSFFSIPVGSNNFVASVANGYLPVNTVFASNTNYYSIIRVTDNAGNTRTVSSLAWTYVPLPIYTYQRPVSATALPEDGTGLSQGGSIVYNTSGIRLSANSAATGASMTYTNSLPNKPAAGTYNIKLTVTYQIQAAGRAGTGSTSFCIGNKCLALTAPSETNTVGSFSKSQTLSAVTMSGTSTFTFRVSNGNSFGGAAPTVLMTSLKVEYVE